MPDFIAMTTADLWDYVEEHSDHTLASPLAQLRLRHESADESHRKLWLACATDRLKAERDRLDREAIEAEHHLG